MNECLEKGVADLSCGDDGDEDRGLHSFSLLLCYCV